MFRRRETIGESLATGITWHVNERVTISRSLEKSRAAILLSRHTREHRAGLSMRADRVRISQTRRNLLLWWLGISKLTVARSFAPRYVMITLLPALLHWREMRMHGRSNNSSLKKLAIIPRSALWHLKNRERFHKRYRLTVNVSIIV